MAKRTRPMGVMQEALNRPGVILRGGVGRWQFPTLGKALRFAQRKRISAPLFLDRITRRVLNPGRKVL